LARVARWCLDEQVVVVVHQAAGVTPPAGALCHFAKTGEKQQTILIVKKDRIPCVAARSHMMDCTGKFKSKLASHVKKIGLQASFISRLDPFGVVSEFGI
jgi:hypothetical protein